MTEVTLVLNWLSGILLTDSVLSDPVSGLLGGFHTIPPLGTQSPFGIVRQETASEDLTGLNNAVLVWSPVLVQVNIYERVRHDFTRIDPLAARCYALLQAASGVISGGTIFSCHRLTSKASVADLGGTQERSIEQRFMIEARAS